jgi:hypothetical protein
VPDRSWGNESSSSSSNNSSSHSSSSHSSSSSSDSSSYSSWSSGGNDGNGESGDPIYGYIALGILVLIGLLWLSSNLLQQVSESRKRTDATATTHKITLNDLAMMHAALDSQLSRWRELGKTTPTYVGAETAGFSKSSNTAEVVYGYCDDDKTQFYVYVLNEAPPSNYRADTEGYAWIKNSTPSACHPAGWRINDYVRVTEEAGWYFALMSTGRRNRFATQPSIIRTRTPTPLPREFF